MYDDIRYILSATQQYPSHFYGTCTIRPNYINAIITRSLRASVCHFYVVARKTKSVTSSQFTCLHVTESKQSGLNIPWYHSQPGRRGHCPKTDCVYRGKRRTRRKPSFHIFVFFKQSLRPPQLWSCAMMRWECQRADDVINKLTAMMLRTHPRWWWRCVTGLTTSKHLWCCYGQVCGWRLQYVSREDRWHVKTASRVNNAIKTLLALPCPVPMAALRNPRITTCMKW